MMPDDLFIKLPNFVKINFGTAKVHLCCNLSIDECNLNVLMINAIFLFKTSFGDGRIF